MRETESKRCFSIEEVTNMYGIGRTTVYEEISKGNLKSFKVGQRRLISIKALEAWEKKLQALSEGPK